ncbi:MAG: hypothetical protein EOM20_06795 [Spartobacteria bacterium]|nr:hypothetical protein [Spartobacteria bacterium]
MKKYTLTLLVSLITVCVLCADEPDRSAVRVDIDPYNQGATIGFDLLGIRGYRPGEWAQESPGVLKVITYPLDYVGYMVVEHPFQTLLVTLGTLELTTQWPSDTIKSIFGDDDDDDDDDPEPTPAPTPKPGTQQDGVVNTAVDGDGNTVTTTTTINYTITPPPTPAPVTTTEGGY